MPGAQTASVEKCLKTLRSCIANASDSHDSRPDAKSGKSTYDIEAYEDEGMENYEGEAPAPAPMEASVETYEETYVLEGAPYVSTGMTRMGVLLRILFAIFLILFVLYMSKQV